LTIPQFIAKYQEHVFINKLQQTYAQLVEAFKLMVEDYGTIDTYELDTDNTRGSVLYEKLPKYLKGSLCQNSTDFGQCNTTAHYKDFTYPAIIYGDDRILPKYTYTLPNGAAVLAVLLHMKGSCEQNMGRTNVGGYVGYRACGTFYVDLNGKTGPNMIDVDLFKFFVVKDGIIPAGVDRDEPWTMQFEQMCLNRAETLQSAYNGGFCTAWVLANKNMDYRRCPEKLGWHKASSCKE